MDRKGFNQAKKAFPLKHEMSQFAQDELERKKFVDYFTKKKIANMTLDEYAEGKGIRENNFCYGLEFGLGMLGSINGSNAKKFGLYYDKKNKKYWFAKKYGRTRIEAFNNIKESIIDLLDAGKRQDYESIIDNPLAPTIKGKILYVYFPDTYLNIFSDDHLDYYLRTFDLLDDELMYQDEIYKRAALLDFKNNDPDMKSWSINMFAVFLWKYFPKAPDTRTEPEPLTENEKKRLVNSEKKIRKGGFGFGGEGEQHKELKEYIFDYPEVIGITKYKDKSTEHYLLSGDRIDVWFELKDGSEIAVEVKSSISSDADILRGLYQCVKYQAIMDAEDSAHDETHDNQVMLVLGGTLSKTNSRIRDCFGIPVFENIEPE